jgi:hypothetical protein
MTDDSRMSGALQQNVLLLLCFSDEHCKLIRSNVTPQLFESAPYREVAGVAIDFIDQYGEAIKEHLPDQLEHILTDEDEPRKAESYKRLLDDLFSAKDEVNGEYVVSQLHRFVRAQRMKDAVIKSAELLKDGKVDELEVLWQAALKAQMTTFEGGLDLSNADDVASLVEGDLEEPGFELGIPEFDRRGFMPRRKELFLFIAPRGAGKSWFATYCAKQAIKRRWSPLIVSLEMSERRYGARFLQAFFAISKREALVRLGRFKTGRDGSLEDILYEQVEHLTMVDADLKTKIVSKAKRTFRKRAPFRIKSFPTGSLTIEQLEAYLDGLERYHNFIPDALIIDYPDLMAHDIKNKRLELGRLNERIRGICVARNLAGIILSQPNAEGEASGTVRLRHAAEDISKGATVDYACTYSQTDAEAKLGLARLLADKNRNDEDGYSVLITQSYQTGQFCLDSVLLETDYWELLEERKERAERGRRPRRDADEEEQSEEQPPQRSSRRRK